MYLAQGCPGAGRGQKRRRLLLVPAFWGAVSIVAMWLAVLFDGIFGGDMVFSNPSSAPDHHPVGGGRRAVRLHRDDGRGQARLHPPGS